MKKLIVLIVAMVLGYGIVQEQGFSPPVPVPSAYVNDVLLDAQIRQISDLQLTGQGVVVKVLRDDLDGSKHQRFILDVGSGNTVLVSHNIDLAPRVDNIAEGDNIEFAGEYKWNSKGGVVHWTHHDPAGRHPEGWIRHHGRTYK
jgi:hypothetical protein